MTSLDKMTDDPWYLREQCTRSKTYLNSRQSAFLSLVRHTSYVKSMTSTNTLGFCSCFTFLLLRSVYFILCELCSPWSGPLDLLLPACTSSTVRSIISCDALRFKGAGTGITPFAFERFRSLYLNVNFARGWPMHCDLRSIVCGFIVSIPSPTQCVTTFFDRSCTLCSV